MRCDLSTEKDGECDGRVVVGSADGAACVDDGSKADSDGERGVHGVSGGACELDDEEQDGGAGELRHECAKLRGAGRRAVKVANGRKSRRSEGWSGGLRAAFAAQATTRPRWSNAAAASAQGKGKRGGAGGARCRVLRNREIIINLPWRGTPREPSCLFEGAVMR
jgi:hypothetical protein